MPRVKKNSNDNKLLDTKESEVLREENVEIIDVEDQPKKKRGRPKKNKSEDSDSCTVNIIARKGKRRKQIEDDKDFDSMYEDTYDDDDEDFEESSNIIEDEEDNSDDITDEEMQLAKEMESELSDFENYEEGSRRVYKSSSNSEQIRERFYKICEKFNSDDENLKAEGIAEAIDELKSFVHYIIKRKYSTYGKYYEDLVQEGIIGIIKGLEKYDPEKSLPTTFFNLYIIHEMSKYIDTEVNKTTSHYSSNLTKINRVIDKFEAENKKWNATDIAITVGLNMETVTQCLHIRECKNEMSYESDEILEANITEHTASPEAVYIEEERTNVLYKAIATLSPEEIKVLKYRFGLANTKVISYKEIAEKMGISIEKVRKYRHDAIRKLKNKPQICNMFKDYAKHEASLTDNCIAFIPEDVAEDMIREIEELDIDFDFGDDE